MLYNFIPTVNRKVFLGEVQSFKTHLKSAGTQSFPVQQVAVPWHNRTMAEVRRSLGAGIRKAHEASLSNFQDTNTPKKKRKKKIQETALKQDVHTGQRKSKCCGDLSSNTSTANTAATFSPRPEVCLDIYSDKSVNNQP